MLPFESIFCKQFPYFEMTLKMYSVRITRVRSCCYCRKQHSVLRFNCFYKYHTCVLDEYSFLCISTMNLDSRNINFNNGGCFVLQLVSSEMGVCSFEILKFRIFVCFRIWNQTSLDLVRNYLFPNLVG